MIQKFEVEIAAARKRVEAMNQMDRQGGFLPLSDCPVSEQIGVAMAALECALQTSDWEVVADAYVLLQDARSMVDALERGEA